MHYIVRKICKWLEYPLHTENDDISAVSNLNNTASKGLILILKQDRDKIIDKLHDHIAA